MSIVFSFIIGISFFFVFSYTIYLDGRTQKINKDITLKDQHIYRLQREIQNLKIRLECYRRKDYIVSKINKYNLQLRTPGDCQVIDLSSGPIYRKFKVGDNIAYNQY
ncbi:MAG: hypothetical protein K9L78_00670 [Victivallales bacterium]|nr:hypothetical protein [Victivallales bacterium]MCF7888609.1 hypothetical protein [Victivallales bacterium]